MKEGRKVKEGGKVREGRKEGRRKEGHYTYMYLCIGIGKYTDWGRRRRRRSRDVRRGGRRAGGGDPDIGDADDDPCADSWAGLYTYDGRKEGC